MTKNKTKNQVLRVAKVKDICFQCGKQCQTTVDSPKGLIYLCSNQCKQNFQLQAGLKGYNQVRHHEKELRLTTVGKLKDLNAEEIENMFRFKHKLTRNQMNGRKNGDTIDKLFNAMGLKPKAKRSRAKVQTRLPFTWTIPEDTKLGAMYRKAGFRSTPVTDRYPEEPDNLPW